MEAKGEVVTEQSVAEEIVHIISNTQLPISN
jgi:hypothetical protein